MKRGIVVGVVVVHVVVVAGVLLQGCGKTVMSSAPAATPSKQAGFEPVLPPGEQKPASLIPTTPLPKPPSKAEVKPAPLPPSSTIHVVARGENLTVIAKRYGVKPADLMALNRLANANHLREGQELVVPAIAGQGTSIASGETATQETAGQPVTEVVYTVVRGDSLGKIASRHGTKVATIKQRNGLKSDVVRIGQKLKISAAGADVPAVKPAKEAPAVQKPLAPAAKPAPALLLVPEKAPAPAPAARPSIDLDAKPVAAPSADVPKVGGAETVPLLVHEVQPNEDLVKIAMMYGVSVEAVKKANGMTNESVRPGQRLKIP
jgi:LysM repeat protein